MTVVCLVLAGCFGDEKDHLILYFHLVAWGLGSNNGRGPRISLMP
jgi:hypothetical protein